MHPRPHPSLPDPSQPHQVLSDEHAREMCLRFADMECKLGEIDRARAIYSFCSQICDPRVGTVLSLGRDWGVGGYGQADQLTFLLPSLQTTGAFWQTWKDFEVRHGNEDTIREMLRIRRSVQATYNTQVNFMASQMLKVSGSATGTGEQALAVGAGLPGQSVKVHPVPHASGWELPGGPGPQAHVGGAQQHPEQTRHGPHGV